MPVEVRKDTIAFIICVNEKPNPPAMLGRME